MLKKGEKKQTFKTTGQSVARASEAEVDFTFVLNFPSFSYVSFMFILCLFRSHFALIFGLSCLIYVHFRSNLGLF